MLVLKCDLTWITGHADPNSDELCEKPICRAHGITLSYVTHTHDVLGVPSYEARASLQSVTHIFCAHCMPNRKLLKGDEPATNMSDLVHVDDDLNPIDNHPRKEQEVLERCSFIP